MFLLALHLQPLLTWFQNKICLFYFYGYITSDTAEIERCIIFHGLRLTQRVKVTLLQQMDDENIQKIAIDLEIKACKLCYHS